MGELTKDRAPKNRRHRQHPRPPRRPSAGSERREQPPRKPALIGVGQLSSGLRVPSEQTKRGGVFHTQQGARARKLWGCRGSVSAVTHSECVGSGRPHRPHRSGESQRKASQALWDVEPCVANGPLERKAQDRAVTCEPTLGSDCNCLNSVFVRYLL